MHLAESRLKCFAKLCAGLLAIAFSAAGCGGPTGTPGSGNTPQMSITVTPATATIQVGQSQAFSATLTNVANTEVTWQVEGVTGGDATHGTISASGQYTAPPAVPSPATVTIKAMSVADATKSATATVMVTSTVSLPTVTLSASPTTIVSGSSSTLTWSSMNATSCTASGSWSGAKATSGTQSVSPTVNSSYSLACPGAGGSASAAASITVNATNPGAPSAPTNVRAYATTTGVYVLFAPPVNAGSLALTQYTATTNTGYSASVGPVRIQNEGNTMNYMQLNARIDINGVPAGTSVTVTVTAANSSGTSPASAPSNQVTPMVYAPVVVADGGGFTAESPSWGDYSYGGFPIYGVTPGTLSGHGTGSYPAPSNPINAADNVAEYDNPNPNGGFQPYFHHQNPNNNQNGRLNLSPYANLVVSVWPTANQAAFQQGLFVGVLKCLWINGAISSSGSTTLVDATQNWPANIFVGALITDITNGNTINVTSNTSDTLTFANSVPMSPGDFYEISVPDIGIGQGVIVGNGTATSYGPANLVSGQWNSYTIPLTAFNGGGTNYPNVTGDQILKFNLVLSSGSAEVHYFSNVEFR